VVALPLSQCPGDQRLPPLLDSLLANQWIIHRGRCHSPCVDDLYPTQYNAGDVSHFRSKWLTRTAQPVWTALPWNWLSLPWSLQSLCSNFNGVASAGAAPARSPLVRQGLMPHARGRDSAPRSKPCDDEGSDYSPPADRAPVSWRDGARKACHDRQKRAF
jgi:hypothetical protein